jgi:propanol-preferring alcohol dehydrogenase
MMKAFRLLAWQQAPQFQQVPVPEVGPGQVLVRVAGVGLCHTDIHFFDVPAGTYAYDLPFTLGHEIAGWVAEVGPGVSDLEIGAAVVASAHYWCGQCANCLRGQDNYCLQHNTGLGYGRDGGLAEYVLVTRHSLVKLGSVDPRHAGPLADAGSTAYHAFKRVAPKLVPGSHAVVIGAGGLGSYLIQYLRQLTAAHITVIDTTARRLDTAKALGADVVLTSGPDITEQVKAVLPGGQAEAVFDLVGSDATIATALACSKAMGAVAIVGAAHGVAPISWTTVARECDVFIPQGGTIPDLNEVVALLRRGRLTLIDETFAFDDITTAYDRLRANDLPGRAVVVMDQPSA